MAMHVQVVSMMILHQAYLPGRSSLNIALALMQFHKATPEPTNEYVKIMSTPPSTAYVLSFGGFLVDDLTVSPPKCPNV